MFGFRDVRAVRLLTNISIGLALIDIKFGGEKVMAALGLQNLSNIVFHWGKTKAFWL